jgi:glycosyltransferase involved in cell wall biosynthesis
MKNHLLHVPTPGDHYSPRTGSAIMTTIYELSRLHARAGGETTIVLRRGAVEGYEPYTVGNIVEVELGELPDRRAKKFDVLRGAMGLQRDAVISSYASALDALTLDFDGYAVVHNSPGVISWLARARPGVPICLFAHNTLFRTYTRREARRVVDASYRVLCLSEFLAEDLRRRTNRDDDRVRVVRNGVDADVFTPISPRPDQEPPVILFLGRVIPDKGVDILVRAALLLRERGVRFRLRVVGSNGFSATDPLSPYELRVRESAAPLGESVEFLPFHERARVPSLYRDADIFCMPSNCDEAFGLCLLEAMATGLPCVASSRGGIPEAGGDAVSYFEPPNHRDLAEELTKLLQNQEERHRIGRKARERTAHLSWTHSYRELTAALEE